MFGIGGWELLLIFVIILLVFGAKRLPEIARSLGKATNEFKKAKNELATLADDSVADESPAQKRSTKPAETKPDREQEQKQKEADA